MKEFRGKTLASDFTAWPSGKRMSNNGESNAVPRPSNNAICRADRWPVARPDFWIQPVIEPATTPTKMPSPMPQPDQMLYPMARFRLFVRAATNGKSDTAHIDERA